MVSSTQVMYTRALPSLSPLPIGTPATDKSIIPYYSVYFQDTWHMKPSFTLTYGLAGTWKCRPMNCNGKQVALVDDSGQPIDTASFLNQRNQAALQGGRPTRPNSATKWCATLAPGSSIPTIPTMANSARAFRLPGIRTSATA